MIAVRLHGPRDLRVEDIPPPGKPGKGEVRISVSATGICGSDLHTYVNARIGDTSIGGPLIIGHEFSGVVAETGEDPFDGMSQRLAPGMRVAVDPAQPCGRCDLCQQGHPNLCRHLHFCGLYPDDGCLRESMVVPSRTCFPLPPDVDAEAGALLEPLGVALHAVDLAHLKVGQSVAVLGAGPIGLCIIQAAKLAGAGPIFASEKLPWRMQFAQKYGATPIDAGTSDPVDRVLGETGNRGVDVAFEAAWGGQCVQQAAGMASPGGQVILVGIPEDDGLSMTHSTGRRKGLTLRFARRMKHTYPRAIELVQAGSIDVRSLISHRMQLRNAPDAFALNADYRDGVVKVMIRSAK
jgi:L-iditol 2-dehydrogenase